jgi:hypothetical protein
MLVTAVPVLAMYTRGARRMRSSGTTTPLLTRTYRSFQRSAISCDVATVGSRPVY